jgi:hypothetical protein
MHRLTQRSKHHRPIQGIPDLIFFRSELVDRLLYAMALIGEQRRKDGIIETSFDPDEIFQKMILEKLFKTDDGVAFQEIVALAIQRKVVWKDPSQKWLWLST